MSTEAPDQTVWPQEGGAAQTAKDLFSGAVGGIAQVLIGQPFDIVKVRLQTTTTYPSALNAAATIWSKEGPLAFYKGTLTPLLGIGACVSIQFGAFHQARRWFEARNSDSPHALPAPLAPSQALLAGAYAGIANTVLSAPIEHVRIRLQTQPHGAARLYAGPLDCVRKLGLWGTKGVYRGTGITVAREAAAYGVWFMSFEALMGADARRNAIARDKVPTWKVALYGGLAGEALWLASYPMDVIKSKMQTDGVGGGSTTAAATTATATTTTATTTKAFRYSSARDCIAQTWRAEGWRGFWRGIGPTLLRAMPVSAGTFAVVEMTMRAIN